MKRDEKRAARMEKTRRERFLKDASFFKKPFDFTNFCLKQCLPAPPTPEKCHPFSTDISNKVAKKGWPEAPG